MITNREEIIDRAFGVFVRMNYEKASIITLARACGLTKTGIVYYFPHKLDLFMAVADKYVLQMHKPDNKFTAPADTLAEFIGQYVAGVAASMKRILELIGDNHSPHDCSPNFYYFHFLSQVRMYYPGIRQKSSGFSGWSMSFGRKSYRRRKRAEKSGATRTCGRRQPCSGRFFSDCPTNRRS